METLCVTFEEWLLGDGNYPPLRKGQNVNLSFYIYPSKRQIGLNERYYFEQITDSNYKFSGKIIRNYVDHHKQIIVVDTGSFKFYLEEFDLTFKAPIGQFIYGVGQVLLDCYTWVEYLDEYPDPPNIFYNFRIQKIERVTIPEKFINRHENGCSYPTSLLVDEYGADDIQEIEDMNDDAKPAAFYLVELISIDEEIAKTFIG